MEGKRKRIEPKMWSKKEKKEKVEFKREVRWEAGSLFGARGASKESKAVLLVVLGLEKLREVGRREMYYYNSCRMMGGYIGSFCKRCKSRLV